MKKCASLASTILVVLLCYSVYDYVETHKKRHRKKAKSKTTEPQTTTTTQKTESDFSKLRPWEGCEPPERYVFLKKHKVASSALKTMFTQFERFTGIYSEPQLIRPQGGCYPARINAECLKFDGYEKIEGIKYHFRWNIEEIDQLLEPGTVRVTSIREPLSCFRSAYNYFYARVKKSNPSCDMPCWREPFFTMTGQQTDVKIGDFLGMLPDVFDPAITRNFRARNYQSFELGMDHLNNDEDYIANQVRKLDSQFDLVILTEYFLESLVLLAEKLCIPYEVLYTPRRNSRDYELDPIDETQMDIFNEYFKQDIIMYDYFNQTLQAKIDAFGRERMAYEVGQMRALFSSCQKNKGKCNFHRKKRPPPPRRPRVKMEPATFLHLMEENYGTCDNPGSSYQKLKTLNFTAACEWSDVFIRRNFILP